jgi:hypothetical protein
MSLTGNQDSFYVTLTSSGANELFPNNKPGDFCMQFNRQFILDSHGWEVGLHTLTYPYEFNTVGDNAQVHFRYDNDAFLVEIPKWHCSDVNDMCKYLTEKMSEQVIRSEFIRVVAGNEYGEGNSLARYSRSTMVEQRRPIVVSADATRRVTFAFATPFVDLGLSDRLLEMLGFSNQQRFSLEQFAERQKQFMKIRDESRHHFLKFSTLTNLENIMKESQNAKYSKAFFQAINTTIGTAFEPQRGDIQDDFEEEEKNEPEDNDPAFQLPNAAEPPISFNSVEPTRIQLDEVANDGIRRTRFSREANFSNFSHHVEMVLKTNHDESLEKGNQLSTTFKIRPPKPQEFQQALTTFEFAKFLQFYKISEDGNVRGTLPAEMNPFELMYIYTDIVKPEPFDNMMIAMLEIVKTEGTQGNLTQYRSTANIQYKNLDRPNISNIRILIASDQGKPIPFMRGPLVITLHFRRRHGFR